MVISETFYSSRRKNESLISCPMYWFGLCLFSKAPTKFSCTAVSISSSEMISFCLVGGGQAASTISPWDIIKTAPSLLFLFRALAAAARKGRRGGEGRGGEASTGREEKKFLGGKGELLRREIEERV